ncbi:hypothetical protein HPSA20_1395 [Helicobacter pylori SouthAfrica20]|uniref:Uncharacterized protein n=1 Tax=Helicobacter pylori SouthAfrica20 TaxID=1352356 RepID=T1UB38_HELPX|nr:hypothetical protein HPSA20_1395 [Helicobacter pylori SouthAfrica20]
MSGFCWSKKINSVLLCVVLLGVKNLIEPCMAKQDRRF